VAVRAREKLKVPNPAKAKKGRLDAPGSRVHKSKRRYRRRAKHPSRHED
jgi:hypothetical protein